MADIEFPTYGIILTDQFKEIPAPNVRRSEFELGDIKQARISGMQRIVQNIAIVFTHVEFVQFKAWFRDDAYMGALYFNAVDHADGGGSPIVTKEFRIVNGAYEATPTKTRSHWFVTMQWERFE